MIWTSDLEDFLAKAMECSSDREIAQQLTYITGEVISARAVGIKRQRLGLLRRKSPGRAWGTRWNPRNVM